MLDGDVVQDAQGAADAEPVPGASVHRQRSLSIRTGQVLFADSASFALDGGSSGAHLSGTAQSLPDGPDTPVTVDVTR